MQIIILFIILIVVRFIVRALFNTEWRKGAQAKVDGIKDERFFWRLVDGFDGIMLGINDIFTIHLDTRHLAIAYDHVRTENDKRILRLLKRKKSTESLNALNDALEKSGKIIDEMLVENSKSYTKEDIKKSFETHKNERMFVLEQYDKLVSYYLDFLPDRATLKGGDIWNARKKMEDLTIGLEWKTENVRVDAETLFELRKAEVEIGEVVANILCGKDSMSGKLRDSLVDWKHIQMLRSCVVDLVMPWLNTNLINRFVWEIITEIATV